MPVIQVVKPFTFQKEPARMEQVDPMDPTKTIVVMQPSEFQYFGIGIYDVDDATAQHWYVKAHLKDYVPPAKTGTIEYQMAMMERNAPPPPDPAEATQLSMPADAQAPRPAPIMANVTRVEPIQ